MNNSKVKFFSKNLILFTISSLGTKLITFLLVPLYTNFLSSTEYGIIDLISTIISISCPILTFSMDSVILRYCLDEGYQTSQVTTTGLTIWLRSLLLNFAVCIPLYFIIDPIYRIFFIISYYLIFMFQSLTDILDRFYKGTDNVQTSVVTAFVRTVCLGVFNIIFLTVFRLNMAGYVFAIIISSLICIIWGCSKSKFYKYISKNAYSKSLSKEMQKYGGALAFNQIGWWLNNSLDKYVVIFFLGMSENGIYSIAYKIPTILTILGNVFADAWGISAVKEFKSKDVQDFSSQMYSIYNSFLILICAFLLLLNIPIAKILFAKEFFAAWKFTGILLISSVFNGLSGFVGAFFSAAKDAKSYAISTIAGGAVNFIMSVILVNIIGTQGVAIGTLISSILIWIIRVIRSRRHIFIKIRFKKDILMYSLLTASCIIGLYGFKTSTIAVQALILIILFIMNFSNVGKILIYVKNKIYIKK